MTKTYAIYARQSLDREGAGLAVSRQVEDCRELAGRLGLAGDAVIYSDNDLSASKKRGRRPGYEDLLEALRDQAHEVLVIWHNDRLHRRPMEMEQFIELAEQIQLQIHTVRAGQIDMSTPTGRMYARIVGAVARQEVEHKSERRRRSNLQRAMMGYRVGGTRGFGYGRTVTVDGQMHDRDLLDINEAEAAAIRDAAVRMIGGEITTSIWRSWNEDGYRTPHGKLWEASTFNRTMTRPALAGYVVYRKQILDGVTARAPAILTRDQLAAVKEIFADPARRRPRRQPIRGLVDRVATCGGCGEPVRVRLNSSRPRNDGTRRHFRTYSCPAKPVPGHCYIVTDIVDEIVIEAVTDVLARISRTPTPSDFESAAHHATRMELEQVREREHRVVTAIADGLIAREMAERTLRRIRDDRARTIAALDANDLPIRDQDDEPYAVAERFLRRLPAMKLEYWPVTFTEDPALRALAIREDIHDDFLDLPLLAQQAVIRSTVRVVITPRAAGGDRIRVTPL